MAQQRPRSSTGVFRKTLDLSSVPAQSVQYETLTVAGLRIGQRIGFTPETWATSFAAGLIICGAYVGTNGILTVILFNPTTAAINPASQAYVIEVR